MYERLTSTVGEIICGPKKPGAKNTLERFGPRKARSHLLNSSQFLYPQDRDNFGKLRLNPDRWRGLERFSVEIILGPCFLGLPEDGAATDQVVGEVTAHQAYNRYGP